MGSLIKFVPHPVTTGFTCGIAITIISTQVKDFLGLPIGQLPGNLRGENGGLRSPLSGIERPHGGVGLACVAAIKLWPKAWNRRVPGPLMVVVLGTVLAKALHLKLETIGSRFGPTAIPRSLPSFHLPILASPIWAPLVLHAVAIALLAAIESLLSAVVADGMIDDRHDSNQELMAQGVANFISPLFGGIPVTGVIARTATNIRSGANSPLAGIVHAVTLLAIILVAAPWRNLCR